MKPERDSKDKDPIKGDSLLIEDRDCCFEVHVLVVTLPDSQGMMGANLEMEMAEDVINHTPPSNLLDIPVFQDASAADVRTAIKSRQTLIK